MMGSSTNVIVSLLLLCSVSVRGSVTSSVEPTSIADAATSSVVDATSSAAATSNVVDATSSAAATLNAVDAATSVASSSVVIDAASSSALVSSSTNAGVAATTTVVEPSSTVVEPSSTIVAPPSSTTNAAATSTAAGGDAALTSSIAPSNSAATSATTAAAAASATTTLTQAPASTSASTSSSVTSAASQTSAPPSSTSVAPTTTPTKEVSSSFEAKLTLGGQTYHEDMGNKSSAQYRQLLSQVEQSLTSAASGSATGVRVTSMNVTSGSIIISVAAEVIGLKVDDDKTDSLLVITNAVKNLKTVGNYTVTAVTGVKIKYSDGAVIEAYTIVKEAYKASCCKDGAALLKAKITRKCHVMDNNVKKECSGVPLSKEVPCTLKKTDSNYVEGDPDMDGLFNELCKSTAGRVNISLFVLVLGLLFSKSILSN